MMDTIRYMKSIQWENVLQDDQETCFAGETELLMNEFTLP